jgi:hypothetical protein
MTTPIRILSLGAGVQSTTLALMAAHGEIGPMPDCAIFADTQWEPRRVYALGEVDLTTAEDHGQINLFGNECEGMCGV